MSPDIARLDLRLRRRSTLAYSIGFVAYALLIVALYPSFKADTSLDDLTRGNPTLSALFGATGSLTSPDGWMNANLYANFVPLFVLLMTIGYAAGAIAGQDEDGTLGGLASLPLTRGRVLGEKVASLGTLALPIPVVTLVAALLGPAFDLELGTRALLGATLGAVLMGFDLGLVALALGAWTGRRGVALGVAAAVAAASYVISSLAPVVHWMHSLRYLSLIYWSVGNGQLRQGLHLDALVVLVTVAAVLVAVTAAGFRRLDIH